MYIVYQLAYLFVLSTVIRQAETVTCDDVPAPCSHGTYCLATAIDEVSCIACSKNCDGCLGSGPDNCKACAVGYKKEFALCVGCDDGFYGANCTGICRCLNSELCRKADGFCEGWKCARGYQSPPYCNKTCSENTYGIGCTGVCHCPPNDTCSPINGLCTSGRCNINYGGPSCSIRLPQLMMPPDVGTITCTAVRLQWEAFNVEKDVGENSIGQYSVFLQQNGSDWTEYVKLQAVSGQDLYVVNVFGLVTDVSYRFRVDTHRVLDNKIQRASPGLASEWTLHQCPGTTAFPPTTSTRSYIGARVFDDVNLVLQSNGSAYVKWNMSPGVKDVTFNVRLTYRIIGIGDCANLTGADQVLIVSGNDTSITIPESNLVPYRKYQVTVEANGTSAVISDKVSKVFYSLETLPTGVISGFNLKDRKNTSVEITWDPLDCRLRGGSLIRYHVTTVSVDGTFREEVDVTERSVRVENLSAYTSYRTTVRFVNSVGQSNDSEPFVFRTAEGVPSKGRIKELNATDRSIIVTLEPPVNTNGIIREYGISYSDNSNFAFQTSLTHNASLGLTVTIKNVNPFTMYYIKVKARTNGEFGAESDVQSIQTLQDFPSSARNLSLVSRNTTCVTISWQPPAQPNGNNILYKVQVAEVLSTLIIRMPEEAISQSTFTQCLLQSGVLYRFSVTALNSKGDSPPLESDFWTEFSDLPKPPVPVFVNSTFTTITIEISPLVVASGPNIFYQIKVNQVNGKRKRADLPPGYVAARLSQQEVPTVRSFMIGDNRTIGGYQNKPLQANQFYDIYYVVFSELNGDTKFSHSQMESPIQAIPLSSLQTTQAPVTVANGEPNLILIIVLVVIILLIILAVIIALCCWWRNRRRPPPYKPYLSNELDMTIYESDYDPETYWNKVYSFRESRYIIAGRDYLPSDRHSEMNGYTISGVDSDRISFTKEFHALPHQTRSGTTNAATKNKSKNRFPHLLPYDQTRVPLSPDENSSSDYINANYINGYKKEAAYIAAQSPFDEATVLDFWRMIYQENIRTVVIITNVMEDDIVKCTQYWPTSDNAQIRIGSFYLELIGLDEYADYVIRTVVIQKSPEGPGRKVYLFDYLTWPEHGVPRDPIPLLEMRRRCKEYHDTRASPILVHCGTGMGRTGVFIAVDALIEQYSREGRISVFNFVKTMRKQRVSMVRTLGQYIFIYECLFDEFYAGDTIVGQDLKQRYHELIKKNRKTGHSYLRDQFRLLEKFTHGPPVNSCSDALLPNNLLKNRFQDVIPHNEDRPLIITPGGTNRTDYINGLYVDGHRKPNKFIITQTPLHTTIIDFWKMVYDHDISIIVMMENYNSEDDTCAKYWPDMKTKQYEPFFVEFCEVSQEDNITHRVFKLYNLQKPMERPRFVSQFQFNAWSEPYFTPVSKAMMLDLIDHVKLQQAADNNVAGPILVHCKDGATHCGLYTSLSVVLEKMEDENEVDVLHTIRHIKRKRKQIICTMDQYRFIYKALWDFINLRMEGGLLTGSLEMEQTNHAYSTSEI